MLLLLGRKYFLSIYNIFTDIIFLQFPIFDRKYYLSSLGIIPQTLSLLDRKWFLSSLDILLWILHQLAENIFCLNHISLLWCCVDRHFFVLISSIINEIDINIFCQNNKKFHVQNRMKNQHLSTFKPIEVLLELSFFPYI